MKNPEDGFIRERLRSIKFAFRGMWLLVATESSIKVQVFISFVMIFLGFVMKLSPAEWVFQFLAIGLVLVAESLNTAIEKLCNFVHPDFHKKIGFIKDISAGASAFAAVIAVVIGLIIYLPKF